MFWVIAYQQYNLLILRSRTRIRSRKHSEDIRGLVSSARIDHFFSVDCGLWRLGWEDGIGAGQAYLIENVSQAPQRPANRGTGEKVDPDAV